MLGHWSLVTGKGLKQLWETEHEAHVSYHCKSWVNLREAGLQTEIRATTQRVTSDPGPPPAHLYLWGRGGWDRLTC